MPRLGAGFLMAGVVAATAWAVLSSQGSESLGPAGRATTTAFVAWDEPVEVASGAGYQGPWRMNESDFRYVDGGTAHLDDDGSVWLAWVDQEEKEVLFHRFAPDGEPSLDGPVNVSESPDVFSWLPRIARGPPGSTEVYLLWQEILFLPGSSHGGEILFSRSTDGGRTWSEPLNLSNTPAGAGKGRLSRDVWDNGSLDLATGPDGTLLAAWTEHEGALRVSRSGDRGESFSEPVTVAGEGPGEAPARGPALAAGSDGTVHVAWAVGEDPAADIHLARSEDGARTFTQPRPVLSGPGHADAPALAAGPDGTLHLAFGERPDGRFRASAVNYTRLLSGESDFEEAHTLPPPDEARRQGGAFPALRLDAAGNPVLLWELLPDPQNRPSGLAITLSPDGGDTFEKASVVPGTRVPEPGFNGSLQGLLARKLAVSGTGEIAVVSSSFVPFEESRILLHLARRNALQAGGASE